MSVVSKLEVLIGADIGDLTSGLDKADKQLNDFAKKGSSIGKKLATGLAAASGAILGIGAAGIHASVQFESAFAEVVKTVDATDAELSDLRDLIRDMATSPDNPLSSLEGAHETLAQIAALGGQLGIATEDLDEFTQTVGNLTVASDLTADAAATFLAQFANVTGLPVENFDNAADAIVSLGNSMAATESQIVSFATRLAPLAAFGFDDTEILGYSAALASLGVSSELGSTNLLKTISDINTAVAEGGEDLAAFAGIAGQTADEFAAMAASDPAGALDAFLAGLAEMDASEAIIALNDLGITAQEQQALLLRMAEGLSTVRQGLDTATAAFYDTGAAIEALAASTGASETLISGLYERFAPLEQLNLPTEDILGFSTALAVLADRGVTEGFSAGEVAAGLTSIVQAAQGGAPEIEAIATAVGLTVDEFAALATADPGTALETFFTALNGLSADEQLATLQALGVSLEASVSGGDSAATAILALSNNTMLLKNSMTRAGAALEGNNAAFDEAAAKADTTAGAAERLKNNANDLAITIGDQLTPGLATLTDGLTAITQGNHAEGFSAIGTGIVEMVQGLTNLAGLDIDVGGGLNAFFEGAGGLAGLWFDNLRADIDEGIAAINSGVESAGAALETLLGNIERGIQRFVLTTTASFIDFAQGFRQLVLDATGGTVDIAPTLNVTSADIHAQLDAMTMQDSISTAISESLAAGEPIDISGIEIPIGGDFSMNFSDMLATPQADVLAQNAGPDFTAAIQNAMTELMTTALSTTDPAAASAANQQLEMLVPLALNLDIDLMAIQAQVMENLALAAETISTSSEATPTEVTQTITVTPVVDEFMIAGEIQGVVEAIPYTATIQDNMTVTPLLDEGQVTGDTQAIIEAYQFLANAMTALTVVASSVDVSQAVSAVQAAVSSSLQNVSVGVGISVGYGGTTSNINAPAHHSGGIFTPADGGQEGFAWLRRGETVRTEAQESAMQRQLSGGGGGNTFNIYGSSPYEVANMVARADRDRGYS